MEKETYTNSLRDWLEEFLTRKFSSTHEIISVLIPGTSLSKLNDENLKKIPNYSSWEFKSDVLGILKDKTSGKFELVLLNRSMSALSLKEIGEINCYARLTGAFLAMISSLNGVSNEVNILLLEDEIRNRVLSYGEKSILIFGWDGEKDLINRDSIIPLSQKEFLSN